MQAGFRAITTSMARRRRASATTRPRSASGRRWSAATAYLRPGARPHEPRRRAERARDAHPDRERARRRHRVSARRAACETARAAARSWSPAGVYRLAATADAVGHRARRASQGMGIAVHAICRSAPTCTTTSIRSSPEALGRPSRFNELRAGLFNLRRHPVRAWAARARSARTSTLAGIFTSAPALRPTPTCSSTSCLFSSSGGTAQHRSPQLAGLHA